MIKEKKSKGKRDFVYYEDNRVGNYVVTFIHLLLKDGELARELSLAERKKPLATFVKKGYEVIGAIKIRTLEGLFSVTISEDRMMFRVLRYYIEDENEDFLQVLFANMIGACTIPDGMYQDLLFLSMAAHLDSVASNLPKQEKLEKYKETNRLMMKIMEDSLKDYEPKELVDMSEDDYEKAEVADGLREMVKINKLS